MKIIEEIRILKNGNKEVLAEITCDRCNGVKHFEHVKHVEGGRCFKCNGLGVIEKKMIIMTEENLEKKRKREEREFIKREEKRKEMEAKIDEENRKLAEAQKKMNDRNLDFFQCTIGYIRLLKMDAYKKTFLNNLKYTCKFKLINYIDDYDKNKICDMLAKTQGRRGSKAYEATYDEIMNLINKDR